MTSVEEFDFVGSQGSALSGRLHRPERQSPIKGAVLLAHCFTCSKDLNTMTRLAKGLADGGYAAMRFDFTGLGESAGDFAETSVSANVADLTRAAASLIQAGFGPCGLLGHSLGGAASILAAHRLKTVRSLVTVGAPAETGHVRHLFADQLSTLAAGNPATITIASRSFDLNPGFVDDLQRHDVISRLGQLGRPYCTIHAVDDEVVAYENAERLHRAAAPPKRLVTLESGGHMFAQRADADRVLEAALAWFDATL
ncbi:MAG: alpha/beta hydrolase family protein [Acidimicrobiales bacterium]